MRIPCPFCGARDASEFTYLGDAAPRRPDPAGEGASTEITAAFHDYVYLRDNPAGRLEELWYHAGGCRSWLVVARDTRSHAIEGARLARQETREEARP